MTRNFFCFYQAIVYILLVFIVIFPSSVDAEILFPYGEHDIDASSSGSVTKYSYAYDLLIWLHKVMNQFLFKIWDALGQAILGVFYYFVTFAIITMAFSWMSSSKVYFLKVVMFWFFMSLIGKMLVDHSFYKVIFYNPLVFTMFSLPSFIIQTVSSSTDQVLTGKSPLENMFMAMDMTVHKMVSVGTQVATRDDFFAWSGSKVAGWLIKIVFQGLQIVFSGIMLLSVVAVHVLQVFLPITLALAAIPQARGYLIANIKNIILFAIVPTFASIAMAITVEMLADLTVQAQQILDKGQDTLPDDFYMQAVFIGVISLFFHLKASSFAQMIVHGQGGAGFGEIFGTLFSAARGVYRTATLKGVDFASGAFKGRKAYDPVSRPRGVAGLLGYKFGRFLYHMSDKR